MVTYMINHITINHISKKKCVKVKKTNSLMVLSTLMNKHDVQKSTSNSRAVMHKNNDTFVAHYYIIHFKKNQMFKGICERIKVNPAEG